MERYKAGEQARFTVNVVDGAGAGIPSMIVGITIRRQDGQWWNPAGYFQSAFPGATTMTEVDSTNRPGEYVYVFWPHVTDFYVTTKAAVGGGVGSPANGPWYGDAMWGFWADDINDLAAVGEDVETILKRIGSEALDTQFRHIISQLDGIRQQLQR